MVVVALVIVGGIILLLGNKGGQKETQAPVVENQTNADEQKMVDCGQITEPSCFFNRAEKCLPVTGKLTGTDGSNIDITVLGKENGTCHFQRKVGNNNALNLDCHFPGESITLVIIDQTFGNDRGLQDLVNTSCGLK